MFKEDCFYWAFNATRLELSRHDLCSSDACKSSGLPSAGAIQARVVKGGIHKDNLCIFLYFQGKFVSQFSFSFFVFFFYFVFPKLIVGVTDVLELLKLGS